MMTIHDEQWEIEDEFDIDLEFVNSNESKDDSDDDFESFFSSEELDKFRDEFKEFARQVKEFGKPTIVKTYLEMSQEYDDYLNTKVQNAPDQTLAQTLQNLEDKALDFFQTELSNIKLAINYAVEAQQWQPIIDISQNLRRFLNIRTYWQELEEIQKYALEASQLSGNIFAKANILNQLGEIDRLRGRAKEGVIKCEESKKVFQSLNDKYGEAKASYNLGYLNRSLGKFENSAKSFGEALSLFRNVEKTGNIDVREDIADSLDGLGQAYEKQGELDKAEEALRESLKIKEKLNNRFKRSISLNNLGKIYTQKNLLEEAKLTFEECLKIKLEIFDSQGEGTSLNELGKVHRLMGDYDRALDYYIRSLEVKEKVSINAGSTPDKHGQGLTYMEMGFLYEETGEKETTRNYFKLALDHLNDYSPEFKKIVEKIQEIDN